MNMAQPKTVLFLYFPYRYILIEKKSDVVSSQCYTPVRFETCLKFGNDEQNSNKLIYSIR